LKITALLENTALDASLSAKHGLCIYIETKKHKILFDFGPDNEYMQNALALGIDLAEVDIAVLSHGHSDHGGGLAGFLEKNSVARIFARPQAFEPIYYKRLPDVTYIGLDQDLAVNKRISFIGDMFRIDDELLLFSDVEGQQYTDINSALCKKVGGEYIRDDFMHEQNLIVHEGSKAVLFTGCSHRGIDNILRAAYKHQTSIGTVFGGFHLYNPTTKATEPAEVVTRLANELSAMGSVFYTCHCTGEKAYSAMRGIMGDKVRYFSTGDVVEL
jgi:7,8-dihydropterin-6-yl-methyl-4-(beta-D-ribofuranosyl)aminobenzene 5'-phosphate synthase